MIYTNSIITIENEKSFIDKKVTLYRGDKNVQIRFQIVENPYSNQVVTKTVNVLEDGSFAQLVIAREADPIFGEVAEVIGGEVLLTMTGEMIDGLEELGNYDFQIRLFNEDKTSRVTLPPVVAGIIVKEPIAMETPKENAEVNEAMINLAEIEEQAEDIETFVDGKYNKTVWADKDIITDVKLNKIENAIDVTYEKAKEVEEHTHNYAEIEHEHEEYALVKHEHEEYAKEVHKHEEYLTEHQSLEDYATKVSLQEGLEAKADKVHKHEEYLTEHQSLEDYALKSEIPSIKGLATEVYVDEAVEELGEKAHTHTNKAVLDVITEESIRKWNSYAVGGEGTADYDDTELRILINGKADIEHTHNYAEKRHTHDEYAEVEHTHEEYLTEHQDLSEYATKEYVDDSMPIKILPYVEGINNNTQQTVLYSEIDISTLESNCIYMTCPNNYRLRLRVASQSGTFINIYMSYYPNNLQILVGAKTDKLIELIIKDKIYTVYFATETEEYRLETTPYFLANNNTTAYTPTGDYHPATKKYVDDTIVELMGSNSVNDYEIAKVNAKVNSIYNTKMQVLDGKFTDNVTYYTNADYSVTPQIGAKYAINIQKILDGIGVNDVFTTVFKYKANGEDYIDSYTFETGVSTGTIVSVELTMAEGTVDALFRINIHKEYDSNISLIDSEYCSVYMNFSKEVSVELIDEIVNSMDLSVFLGSLNVLTLNNKEEYTPTTDYQPATKKYVDEAVGNIDIPQQEEVDLSNYATKDEIPTKVSELENDKGYLTEHQDLSEYAKKEELTVVEVANNVLTLSTNKYQYANITADTTITLPSIAEFTEIHLYFNIADNFAITLNAGSQIRYQAELVFEANNAYEVICTYVPNMAWLVGAVKYEGAVGSVSSGDIGTPDIVEPF